MPAKKSKIKLPSEKVLIPIIVGIAILAGILAWQASAALLPKQKADIQVRVYDVTGGGKVRLNNVRVEVRPANGETGPGCPSSVDYSKWDKDIRSGDSHNGNATFRDCSVAGGKQQNVKRYVIESATLSGYKVADKTPHKVKTGSFRAFAGKKKKRTTIASLYMVKTATVTPPPPDTPTSPSGFPNSPNNNTPITCPSFAAANSKLAANILKHGLTAPVTNLKITGGQL